MRCDVDLTVMVNGGRPDLSLTLQGEGPDERACERDARRQARALHPLPAPIWIDASRPVPEEESVRS